MKKKMKKNKFLSPHKIIFFLLALFMITSSQAQEEKFFREFNNSTLDYGVYRTSLFQTGSDEIIKPDVFIQVNLSDEVRNLYKKLTIQQIQFALSDSKTDWAINLFLYELYKKSATKFLVIKNREDWLKGEKAEDIKFWTETILKNN
jgi:hypothetical protein